MKNCDSSFENKIVDYYYNELSSEEKSEVEGHLAGCAACREELKSLTVILKKISDVSRPILPGSLYAPVKVRLSKFHENAMTIWNIPLAAGMALLILLSVISFNNNMLLPKEVDLDEALFVSAVFELDSKEISSFELDVLADEIFIEENILSLGI